MTSASDSVNPLVGPDSYLTLHYRIELVSGPAAGSVFANTFDGRPATLQMGAGQWAPSMEQHLLNLEEGSRHSFDLPAADAYGERNPDLLQWISQSTMNQHTDPEKPLVLGDMVEFAAPNGGHYSGVLKEFGASSVLFDFNHPLAGADLKLEVHILGVM
ncbi:FKBP-type peptidyl-prolyl cis-trans isomerase [Alcaligenaceae bacterium]|nr:FKBP-type peptidyl-prolyl cis-trans isomerase [Alcaligenaceae bacterium]